MADEQDLFFQQNFKKIFFKILGRFGFWPGTSKVSTAQKRCFSVSESTKCGITMDIFFTISEDNLYLFVLLYRRVVVDVTFFNACN
jgi:hypothetical protein